MNIASGTVGWGKDLGLGHRRILCCRTGALVARHGRSMLVSTEASPRQGVVAPLSKNQQAVAMPPRAMRKRGDVVIVVLTILFGGVVAAFAGATISAWVSRSIKISEFRQAWINDLRRDISDYVGAAERWFRKWDELNLLPQEQKLAREHTELFPIANDARVILRRIRLRFNPLPNSYKAQDDRFLHNLGELLNPGRAAPPDPEASWPHFADEVVEQAREILKREWEVTKQLPVPRLKDVRWRDDQADSSAANVHH
jgi:hypothetical protein